MTQMTLRLVPQALSVEAFAPFGDVISAGLREGASANQGTAVKFSGCTPLKNLRPGAVANVAVFRSLPASLPFSVKLLEKHPHSTQMFIPMTCRRFLVCVAPTLPNGAPDVAKLVAFVCRPGQGVSYRPGTWHHPIVALDEPAEFTMVAFEDGTPQDCVELPLETPVEVALG